MRAVWILVAASLLCACGSEQSPASPGAPPSPTSPLIRVLVMTSTSGFRHDSIPTAISTLRNLAASTGEFTVTATEDLLALERSNLFDHDVVMFALTSGELPLSAEQKNALLDFVTNGRGFIGVHSATDTLYEWADYGRLIGAYFREHPWTQQGLVIVEDQSHPSTAGLGGQFPIREEFYTFRDNPRGRVQVLLRLDAASVGAAGDYPLAWSQTFGGGRAYYNALGHFSETWTDQRFQRQLIGAIRWTAGR